MEALDHTQDTTWMDEPPQITHNQSEEVTQLYLEHVIGMVSALWNNGELRERNKK